MKKLLKTLAIVAIFGVVLYAFGALAQGAQQQQETTSGLGSVVGILANVFEDVRGVFYVLAAFGLIGLAAAALLGKVQWKWLFALVFGVAIVAAADYIVTYASTGSEGDQGRLGLDDDLLLNQQQ